MGRTFSRKINRAISHTAVAAALPFLIAACTDAILHVQSQGFFQSGPPDFEYNWNPGVYTVGTQISQTIPVQLGGSPGSIYSINPPLPAGLSFNDSNGTITGTPTTSQGLSGFSISASNSYGSFTFPLSIKVLANDGARTWTAAPALSVAVGSPTVTALQDGTALIAGGSSAVSTVTNAYVYNPTNGLTSVGSLNTSRSGAPSVVLYNGQVLIAGGAGSVVLNSAELYNPQTQQFSYTGSMQVPRESHTLTALQDGTVLVTGGQTTSGAYVNSAEIYNPLNGTFTLLGNTMTSSRAGHTATLLQNGTVLITGGCSSPGVCNAGGTTALATAEIYNPATQTFTLTAGNLTIGRLDHMAFALPNGNVLVVAGATDGYGYGGITTATDIYNASTQTFAATTATPVNPVGLIGGVLPNGKVLVVGGNTTGCGGGTTTAGLYDPTANTWTVTTSATAGVTGAGGATLQNGSFLFAGGSTTNCTFTPVATSSIFQ